VHSVSVTLEPTQYLAGWRPDSGTVFLPVLSDVRVGDGAAVRVGIYGQLIRATVFGTITAARRVGRPALPPGVELKLDASSLPAAGFLAAAARGEQLTFKERAPRYVSERKLIVAHGGEKHGGATVNLSESGCSLAWPSRLPLVGELVQVIVKDGLFPPRAEGVVCWTHEAADGVKTIGLHLRSSGRAERAWKALIADVIRSGARPA
jgi:hypothetical protein